MPYTAGFRSAFTLNQHFADHQWEFDPTLGINTAADYLRVADEFIGGPKSIGTLDCRRKCQDGSDGDYIRYNSITEEFCILGTDNFIRTYYIPDPMKHQEPTNLVYFQTECKRVLC